MYSGNYIYRVRGTYTMYSGNKSNRVRGASTVTITDTVSE